MRVGYLVAGYLLTLPMVICHQNKFISFLINHQRIEILGIFCQDFSGDAILCKNLMMSPQWNLKISIELMTQFV